MTLLLLTWLFTCVIPATGADNPKCLQSELLPCGDSRGIYQWEFCSITIPKQRITHVQLDKRYRTRYCTKYNYGITTTRRRFWVHQWCYGTFIVCFVPELNNSKSTPTTKPTTRSSIPDRSTPPARKSTFTSSYEPTKPEKTSKATEPPALTATVSTTEATSESFTLSPTSLVSSFYMTTISNRSLWIQHTDIYSLQKMTHMVWIVMIIGATGGLFLTLIGVVVFIIVKRCKSSSHEVKDEQYIEGDTSTSQLVEPEADQTQTKSVYDFIPFDPDTGLPVVWDNDPDIGLPAVSDNDPDTGLPAVADNGPYTGLPAVANNGPYTGLPAVSDDDMVHSARYAEANSTEISDDGTKLNIYDRTSISPGTEYDVLSRKSMPDRSMSETSNYSHLGNIICVNETAESGHEHIQEQVQTNHVYYILLPVDSEQFQVVDEEHSVTGTFEPPHEKTNNPVFE